MLKTSIRKQDEDLHFHEAYVLGMEKEVKIKTADRIKMLMGYLLAVSSWVII